MAQDDQVKKLLERAIDAARTLQEKSGEETQGIDGALPPGPQPPTEREPTRPSTPKAEESTFYKSSIINPDKGQSPPAMEIKYNGDGKIRLDKDKDFNHSADKVGKLLTWLRFLGDDFAYLKPKLALARRAKEIEISLKSATNPNVREILQRNHRRMVANILEPLDVSKVKGSKDHLVDWRQSTSFAENNELKEVFHAKNPDVTPEMWNFFIRKNPPFLCPRTGNEYHTYVHHGIEIEISSKSIYLDKGELEALLKKQTMFWRQPIPAKIFDGLEIIEQLIKKSKDMAASNQSKEEIAKLVLDIENRRRNLQLKAQ